MLNAVCNQRLACRYMMVLRQINSYENIVRICKLDPLRHAVSEIVRQNSQNNQRLLIYMNDGNQVLISADEMSKKMVISGMVK